MLIIEPEESKELRKIEKIEPVSEFIKHSTVFLLLYVIAVFLFISVNLIHYVIVISVQYWYLVTPVLICFLKLYLY